MRTNHTTRLVFIVVALVAVLAAVGMAQSQASGLTDEQARVLISVVIMTSTPEHQDRIVEFVSRGAERPSDIQQHYRDIRDYLTGLLP